jgi:hypothetical protein
MIASQRCATQLLLPPGLNIPDGRRPDEVNAVCRSRALWRNYKGETVWLTPLLLRLAHVRPPTLVVALSLHPALAPQKFLNFLRGVRAVRSGERPLARDEWLSHRGSILGGNVLLLLLLLRGLAP